MGAPSNPDLSEREITARGAPVTCPTVPAYVSADPIAEALARVQWRVYG